MPKNETATYFVAGMRIVPTTGKVAAKNPDRLMTIHGDFSVADEKGKPKGDVLTFHSKEITREVAANPLTVIDVENSLLTLPSGERGRKALPGIDADAVSALLASVREAAEPEAEAEAEAPTAE